MTFISTLFFIQHSNSLHRTMSLYCMKRDDRDERIEETLKYKVEVAQRKLTYYWLSDRFGINIFAKRLSCGFQIHFHICNLCLEISVVIQCFLNTFGLNQSFNKSHYLSICDVCFHVV